LAPIILPWAERRQRPLPGPWWGASFFFFSASPLLRPSSFEPPKEEKKERREKGGGEERGGTKKEEAAQVDAKKERNQEGRAGGKEAREVQGTRKTNTVEEFAVNLEPEFPAGKTPKGKNGGFSSRSDRHLP